jgi:hypothetical protein
LVSGSLLGEMQLEYAEWEILEYCSGRPIISEINNHSSTLRWREAVWIDVSSPSNWGNKIPASYKGREKNGFSKIIFSY